MMSGLLAWRNPQGEEENWWGGVDQGIGNSWKLLGKIVTTEISLLVLTTTSVVETVAYGIFTFLFRGLSPVSDKPYKFFAKLLESSSFTIIWGIGDALIYNPLFINVMTQESFARYWAQIFNPTSIELFRLEDRLDLADWHLQNRRERINDALLGPIIAVGETTNTLIDQGATFIKKEVLAGASEQTLTLFKEIDASIIMFVLSKAIYIYTAGSRKNDALPDFFKLSSKNLISNLRKELNKEEVLKELEELTSDPTRFEQTPSEASQKAFNSLRNIASGELQNSLFTSRCWQKASAML